MKIGISESKFPSLENEGEVLDFTNGTPITDPFPYQYSRAIINERAERLEDAEVRDNQSETVSSGCGRTVTLMNSQLPSPTEEL